MSRLLSSVKYNINRERLFQLGQWKSVHQPVERMNDPIDFVVTWVDGSDPAWLTEKERYEQAVGIYAKHTDNGEERYRDWDIFQYWFRAVETYAPWVHNVYLVTCGHIPSWINPNAPKLKIIKHTDYIPEQYLPTFSSNPIELNFHRIQGLSEHFVYFNDDVFLNRPVEPEDFFHGGLPNYTAVAVPLRNYTNCAFDHMRFTTLGVINNHFGADLGYRIKAHPERWFAKQYGGYVRHNLYAFDEGFLPGMVFPHLGVSCRKSTMEKVWKDIPNIMNESSLHRFRTPKDVLHQIFSLWEMLDGDFFPVSLEHHGMHFSAPVEQKNEIVNAILQSKYRMICINDSENVSRDEYLFLKQVIIDAFSQIFPKKSTFEK